MPQREADPFVTPDDLHQILCETFARFNRQLGLTAVKAACGPEEEEITEEEKLPEPSSTDETLQEEVTIKMFFPGM